MTNSFRLYKARGQPGKWYGYVTIDDVTYKIDAKHVGERTAKHFEGTVKRHLKSDQQILPLSERMSDAIRRDHVDEGQQMIERAKEIFDDEIPF